MFDYLLSSIKEADDVSTLETLISTQTAQIIVYNDDVNTFDWVIQSLMEVCNHTFVQAEQISIFVHFKGKAVVKTGAFEELKPMKDELVDRGISAVIEMLVDE